MRYPNEPQTDLTKSVQTRNGLPVRILCTDRRGQHPIVALVDAGRADSLGYFYADGQNIDTPSWDLVNVPPPKETAYVNIYRGSIDTDLRYIIKTSRTMADRHADSVSMKIQRIACVKIEYTEGQFDE